MARFRVPSPSSSPPPSVGSGRARPLRTFRVRSAARSPLTGANGTTSAPPRRGFHVPTASSSSSSGWTETSPEPPDGAEMPGAKPRELKSCLRRHRTDTDAVHPLSTTSLDDREVPEPIHPKKRLRWDHSLMLRIGASPDEPRPKLTSPPPRTRSKRRGRDSNAATSAWSDTHKRLISTRKVAPSTLEAVRLLLDHPNILYTENALDFQSEELGRTLQWLLSEDGTLLDIGVSQTISLRYPLTTSMRPPPESFVWHTLVSLLRATHYLHTGHRESTEDVEYPSDWRPIVHNSINPSNVLYMHLEDNGTSELTLYGPCMLGNFSRCAVLPLSMEPADEDDYETLARLDAFDNKIIDHTGYEAPELISDDGEIPGPASDLWSIGAVLVIMMTGRHAWDVILEVSSKEPAEFIYGRLRSAPANWEDVPSFDRLEALKGLDAGRLVAALPSRYSKELRILVEGLLTLDPSERGSAIENLRDAESRMP